MDNRYLSTSRHLGRAVRKHALSTTTRRWTTFGALAAGFLAVWIVPPMGLAVAGTAFAVWWLVVFFVVIFGGLAGNAFGANRTNQALQKQKAGEIVRP